MKTVDIGELSQRSGLPASTLRYYDEIGLISAVGRRGLRRQFGPEAILRLRLVALGKRAGFPLEEIAAMFAADGATPALRKALRQRAAEVERQIKDLTALGVMLRHVAECPARNQLECPRFRKLLRVASRRMAQA